MVRVLILANPIAGAGRAVALAHRVARAIAKSHHVTLLTGRPAELPADELAADPIACVVIGGEGTIRELVERQMSLRPAGPPVPVVPVPFGTANLLARHFQISSDARRAPANVSSMLQSLHVSSIDAATLNGRLFLLMAGVGVDAWIVHALHRHRRGPISKLSYMRPAFASLARTLPPRISVRVDGETIIDSAVPSSPAPSAATACSTSACGAASPHSRPASSTSPRSPGLPRASPARNCCAGASSRSTARCPCPSRPTATPPA
ncbi:MAG TPA: diacylglycerol kinase family protein [Tepidisphaeraceae bacterium]|nr:diacylglycerol kinase family protein [Tepidisphaeraceae bacterium]